MDNETDSKRTPKGADYDFLKYLITKNGGNLSEATRLLNISRPTFKRKLSKDDNNSYLSIEELRVLAEYYHFADGEILKMIFSREL